MTHEIKVKTYRNRPDLSQPAKNPVFPGQHEGEEVLMVVRHHPVVMRKGLIIACLALLAGALPTLLYPSLSVYFGGLAVGALVGTILFLPIWVRWYFSTCILTTERLLQIQQLGFFNRKVAAMFHARIHGVDYKQDGFLATLMNYGTISVLTEVGNFDITDMPHPQELHERILESVRDHVGEDD